MQYNDELVLILDRFSSTVTRYIEIVGFKFTNEQEFRELESKHSFVQDQFKKVLEEIKNFKPTEITDSRKPVLQKHFNDIQLQHENILKTFNGEYSEETLRKYKSEEFKMEQKIKDSSRDLYQKMNK